MRVTVRDSGLCCRVCVTFFERWLTPLRIDSAFVCLFIWLSFCSAHIYIYAHALSERTAHSCTLACQCDAWLYRLQFLYFCFLANAPYRWRSAVHKYEPCSVQQSPLPHSNTTNHAVSVRQSPLPHSNTDKHTKSFLVATYYCRLDHHLSDHHVEATTLKNFRRLIATSRGHHPKYHLTPTRALPFCRIHTYSLVLRRKRSKLLKIKI